LLEFAVKNGRFPSTLLATVGVVCSIVMGCPVGGASHALIFSIGSFNLELG
jgi:hypothetical protein